MENQSHQTLSLEEQIKKSAPSLALGYCLEFVNQKGEVVMQPSEGFWRLEPFEPPHGVPESRMRVLYKSLDGKITPPMDPANPMPTVVVQFGPRTAEVQAKSEPASRTTSSESSPRAPLPDGLHPAAESEESMEREIFSQHIERNEYSNFKLRSETRVIECLYAVIQRMTADQHALLQSTLEMPRRMTQEVKQLVETMGEAMKSFHSMIELQNTALQAVQKQVELARVPPPPPPPPDYVGLGKSLLEIIRDLGMKAMDSGYGRRSLPPRKVEELPEVLDAEVSEPRRPTRAADARGVSDRAAASATPKTSAESGTAERDSAERDNAETSDVLRRVLGGMTEIEIARAFSGPEGFQDFLTNIRREINGEQAQSAPDAPAAAPTNSDSVPTPDSQKTPRPAESSPPSSAKTPLPPSSQTSAVPSARTPQPASTQTPRVPMQGQQRPGSRPPQGAKRR